MFALCLHLPSSCVFLVCPIPCMSTPCLILDPVLPGSWQTGGLLNLSPALLPAHLLPLTLSATAFKPCQDVNLLPGDWLVYALPEIK